MPAAGHVNPTLSLVEELLRRGHRVTYAVGPNMLDAVAATGAEVLRLPSEMPAMPPNPQFTPERMATMMQHLMDDARHTFPLLREHFREDMPDAVCYDVATMTGRMLAVELGVPEICLVPNFASNENFSLREAIMSDSTGFDPEMFAEFSRRMEEFSTEMGVPAEPPMSGPPAPLNLVFLPREFQLAAETFDDRFRFIGPMLGSRADQPWQPRDEHAPVLFISLGTAFNNRPEFYQRCMSAFGGTRWQVAMSVGQHVDLDDLGEIPANFDVRRSFPQPSVLRHASVFLSHTGMNSTMESLYYGVPLVAVPQMPEQAANAARAEELGLGRRLDADTVTAEQLRETVEAVAADEAMRARLREMSAALRDCGGAVAGADALEAHLG
ncbi:macrolide family glycosyltransferase [Saccharopolyspora rosea]|uniref:Macrolide family glycosyltransferase n=1 Tax=Saccharopolyspora rosea TaxID=524884 RepID=A0ABW3FWQ7_9PSEU|nr:macrolide family glycosyltransferase [Saccharopolyspora rosea]